MSASKNSLDTADENVRRASFYVQQVARRFRRFGIKTSHAIQRAADDLGISNDLAWRLHYRQKIFTLQPERLKQIEIHYLKSLDREIAEMERLTSNLRSIKAELEKTLQGKVACSDQSTTLAPGSGQNSITGSLNSVFSDFIQLAFEDI